jgi:hypothetical protein
MPIHYYLVCFKETEAPKGAWDYLKKYRAVEVPMTGWIIISDRPLVEHFWHLAGLLGENDRFLVVPMPDPGPIGMQSWPDMVAGLKSLGARDLA